MTRTLGDRNGDKSDVDEQKQNTGVVVSVWGTHSARMGVDS